MALLLVHASVFAQGAQHAPASKDAQSAPAPKDAPAPRDEVGQGEEYPPEDASDEPAPSDMEDAAEGSDPTPPEGAPKDGAAAAPDDEQAALDEAAAEGEMGGGPAEASRPAPKGKGVVWGRVADSKSDEAALEAQVKVEGRKSEVLTDYDGYYRLELPPGSYTIRYFYELHEPLRLQNVVVTEGVVTRLDAPLEPQEGVLEEVVVEEQAEKATLEGQLLARQQSATVQDGVGRAEIAKTTDSTAAEAAQRVVGATIVDGQFVYVRGLGERYTNSLLNGVPLPSTDPNRASVPLDLFPTQVIDSISIAKTFTPDMPADFAGGSVQIQTRDIPRKFVLAVTLKGAFNDQATFRERMDYRGGGLDFLGIDDGTRRQPHSLPTDYTAASGQQKPDGSAVSNDEVASIGRDVNSYMSATRSFTLPNHGFSVVVGNGFDIDKSSGKRWGYLASINYDRSYTRITDGVARTFSNNKDQAGNFLKEADFEFERGKEEVRWGLYGSVLFDASRKDHFRLSYLRSQDSDDSATSYEGFHLGRDVRLNNTTLVFVSRGMDLVQFQGEHDLPGLGDAVFDYNLFLASATRYEPDTRDTLYYYAPASEDPTAQEFSDRYYYGEGAQAGRHFWSEQTEKTYGGGVNYTQPLGVKDGKFKLGGLVSLKNREFSARRLNLESRGFLFCGSTGSSFDPACPDEHFTQENVGEELILKENTRNSDAYESELNVYAGYMMVDTRVSEGARVIFGPRVEVTHQSVTPVEQLGLKPSQPGTELDDVSLLPGAALVFDVTESSKLRFSASRTLARPQVRELAPFTFSDYFGGREVTGNPDLEVTKIVNGDVRFEYFPSLREVLAVSLFGKHFTDPIEPVLIPTPQNPQLSYVNAKGANMIGVELEARKNLGFVSGSLFPFSVVTNLTLARSRIDIDDQSNVEGETYLTNPSRPLVNQSPVVFNLAFDWEFESGTRGRLLYNVAAKRIVEVGTQGLPDAYQQARHQLDLTLGQRVAKSWDIKVTAENLLNSPVVITQGPTEDSNGQNVSLKYTTGRVFGLSAQYEM